MTEPPDYEISRWEHGLEELDREIGRMALLCRTRILDPAVLERALRNDASVCETHNPAAFAKLHGLLMVHFALVKKSTAAIGEAHTAQIQAHILERLRKAFPTVADDWSPAG
jgi:hypothetical protein